MTLEERIDALEKEIAELKGQVSVRLIDVTANCNNTYDVRTLGKTIAALLHQRLFQQSDP